MSDQEKRQETSITPQPDAEKKESGELSEEELKKVAGGVDIGPQSSGAGAGKVTFNPFQISH